MNSEPVNACDNYFEKKRNELIASIYGRRFMETCRIYEEVAVKADEAGVMSEVEQKAINQLQLAFKRLSEGVEEALAEEMATARRQIRKKMSRIVKAQTKYPSYVSYDAWYKELGLSKKMFSTMLKTVALFQITVGCSNFCRRCNEWALPGVRKHFNFPSVKRLTKELFDVNNREFAYYSASDPLDWRSSQKTIVDIAGFMKNQGYDSKYGLLTKIPGGSEKIAENLILMDADLAVSITKKNRARVRRIEQSTGKRFEAQHETEQLEIPAGLDEDFSSIKPSISDNYGTEITPEGAFLIIPTFTSALNPTGQCRIQVTKHTNFFIKKRVGRDALPVEYFKPLQALKPQTEEFTLDGLLDAQIENILLDDGSPELLPPGMMSLQEYFKVYEPEAVECRRKLLGSVVKGLRKKFLPRGKVGDDSSYRRGDEFRRRVHEYIEFCRMSSVKGFKKNTFSFFLKAVSGYARNHPAQREIVLHLRKHDKKKYEKRFQGMGTGRTKDLESIIEKSKSGLFELFEALMFELLNTPDNVTINKFIDNHPAIYDADSDRFVCKS